MKKVLAIIGTLLLLVYLAVCGTIYSLGPTMTYSGVRIVVADSAELRFVRAADVQHQLTRKGFFVRGKRIGDVNTDSLAMLVAENPLVRRVYCYHTPDSMLRIDVEQRHPIIRVKSSLAGSNGGDFYIDTEGATMPARTGDALPLPLVTGHVSRDRATQLGLYDFARFLQKDAFWRDAITQIDVDAKGEVRLVPRVGNHIVVMGPLDNFEAKLERLRTFYREVLGRKGWNAYSVINVKFDGQVIGERN